MDKNNLIEKNVCSFKAYYLEAKLKYPENPPIEVYNEIYDGIWRRIPINLSFVNNGVFNNLYNAEAKLKGYMDYDCAMSLAYAFISAAKRSAVQVRLVQVLFRTSFEGTKIKELNSIETNYFEGLNENS